VPGINIFDIEEATTVAMINRNKITIFSKRAFSFQFSAFSLAEG